MTIKSILTEAIVAALAEDAATDKLDKEVEKIEDDKKDDDKLTEEHSKVFDAGTFEVWKTPTGKFEVRDAENKKVSFPDLNAAKTWITGQSTKVAKP